jgi:nicotinamide riboside kinase
MASAKVAFARNGQVYFVVDYLSTMRRREQFLITVSGPESSGKTTLTQQLATSLGWTPVAEFAREVLSGKEQYSEADVVRIGLTQRRLIEEALRARTRVLADTDLLTIRIWMEERFGACPEWLMQLHRRQRPDLCLLCAPDLPWEPDPLRENPHDRERLLERHLELLHELQVPYRLVTGSGEARWESALKHIQEFT